MQASRRNHSKLPTYISIRQLTKLRARTITCNTYGKPMLTVLGLTKRDTPGDVQVWWQYVIEAMYMLLCPRLSYFFDSSDTRPIVSPAHHVRMRAIHESPTMVNKACHLHILAQELSIRVVALSADVPSILCRGAR
jgi:hypothetical protein